MADNYFGGSIDKIDQWHLARWSRYTASENYKLLTPPQSRDKYWSSGAMTYIETKALQAVTRMEERPELEEVKSLLWGKVYEFPAFTEYVNETKHYSMTYMGSENPIFLEYEPLAEESGGTPDAGNILSDGKIDRLVEIKCPKNSIEHYRRLKWKDQWDIRENYFSCYTQIQNLLMITGADACDFVSFDDRQILKAKKKKIIEVKPDLKFIDNLDVRIRMAIKEKYKSLSEHLGVEIKNKTDFLKLTNQL